MHTSIIWLMNISPSHDFALSCLSYNVILFTLYRSVIYTLTTPIIVYFVLCYFLPRTSILVLYEDTRTYMCYFLLKLRMCVVLLHVLMNSFTLTSYEWCGHLWNIFATLFPFDDIDIRCTLSIPLVNILLMALNHVCSFRYPLFWNLPIDGSTTLTCHLGSCHPLALTFGNAID